MKLILLATPSAKGLAIIALSSGLLAAATVQTVHFPGEDRQTTLVGYLFEPEIAGPPPAVVLLHGRAGPYSSLAYGVYTAETLSKRHKEWGQFCQIAATRPC